MKSNPKNKKNKYMSFYPSKKIQKFLEAARVQKANNFLPILTVTTSIIFHPDCIHGLRSPYISDDIKRQQFRLPVKMSR